jgi:hypothetical protein
VGTLSPTGITTAVPGLHPPSDQAPHHVAAASARGGLLSPSPAPHRAGARDILAFDVAGGRIRHIWVAVPLDQFVDDDDLTRVCAPSGRLRALSPISAGWSRATHPSSKEEGPR